MRNRGALLSVIFAVAVGLAGIFLFLRSGAAVGTPASAHKEGPAHRESEDMERFAFGETDGAVSAPAARKEDERDSAALEAAVEPLRGNVVVSFGKVEDIGREAGYVLPSLAEMRALASTDPSEFSPEQRRHLLDLQRRYASMLGMLPEIAGFQNDPEEYGKFFSNLAKQSAGLGQDQTSQVDSYMRGRAADMIRSGLNEANKPADPAHLDAWEARRDEFNEQTVDGLRQMLSPQIADRAGINDQLMEFLETDFDKAGVRPGID